MWRRCWKIRCEDFVQWIKVTATSLDIWLKNWLKTDYKLSKNWLKILVWRLCLLNKIDHLLTKCLVKKLTQKLTNNWLKID